MENQFLRTEMVLGADGMDALHRSHVAVFGLGGVGSYAVEALVRSGVGELTLIDDDTVALTNLNRQLEALQSSSTPSWDATRPRAASASSTRNTTTSSTASTLSPASST